MAFKYPNRILILADLDRKLAALCSNNYLSFIYQISKIINKLIRENL